MQQFVEIVTVALCHKEFPGGDIQKTHTGKFTVVKITGQIIIALGVEHLLTGRHPGSDELGNTALHDRFDHFGVFELLTYCNAVSGTYQLR